MRYVMVDDTDPSIGYMGDWSVDTGSLDSSGNWGPPYLSTVHGMKTQGSLSYNFSGPAITLTGAIQVPRTSTSANTTWECFVDGASITVDDPAPVENRIEFCTGSGLTDGPHTLQVNAQGSSSQTFWFDHLQYQPSASVSLANAAIEIDMADPIWDFGTGWTPVFPGYMTNQTGAKVDFEFNGVSFKWYGFYDAGLPFAISTASYSIDGAAPVNFSLDGITAQVQQTMVQNQVFFTTNTVSPGNHKAEVTYNGDTNTTPLSVQIIIVQNGTSTSGGGTTTSGGAQQTGTAPNGSTSNGQTSNTAKSNNAAIVGGILGGVGILLLVGMLFFWMSRRRKYRNGTEASEPITEPEPYFDHPVQMNVYSPVSVPSRKQTHGAVPNDSQGYPPTTATPFQSPLSSTQGLRAVGKTNEQEQPPTRVEASRVVQDVDSGIRLMTVDGDNPELVQVLPPVYSQL